jgi:hypothetical protein
MAACSVKDWTHIGHSREANPLKIENSDSRNPLEMVYLYSILLNALDVNM